MLIRNLECVPDRWRKLHCRWIKPLRCNGINTLTHKYTRKLSATFYYRFLQHTGFANFYDQKWTFQSVLFVVKKLKTYIVFFWLRFVSVGSRTSVPPVYHLRWCVKGSVKINFHLPWWWRSCSRYRNRYSLEPSVASTISRYQPIKISSLI